jgi:hypothetical protein
MVPGILRIGRFRIYRANWTAHMADVFWLHEKPADDGDATTTADLIADYTTK